MRDHAIGKPEWIDEIRFSNLEGRKKNEEEIYALLSEWTSNHTAHDVMCILQEAGVSAGAVQSQADLWEDAQLQHDGFFQWLEHTECGPMPYDGLQFLMSKTPGELRMPQALVGEHNQLILKEMVGLSDDEIADLIVEEVLELS